MKRNQISERARILGISLSSRGFGYAVMEGKSRLVGYGNTVIKHNKNPRVIIHVEKIISHYQPDVLVLHSMTAKGTYRHLRIRELHRRILALARKHNVKVVKLSNGELRDSLLGKGRGTKHEMAAMIAQQFRDDLSSRLPPKRKDWTSEDARMDIFDAVGLAVVARMRSENRVL